MKRNACAFHKISWFFEMLYRNLQTYPYFISPFTVVYLISIILVRLAVFCFHSVAASVFLVGLNYLILLLCWEWLIYCWKYQEE